MIIPSHKIPDYFASLEFPVQVLEEKGDRVVRIEGPQGLMELIEVDAVIGVGSWKRIRHLRLNRPVEALASLRIKLQIQPVAAASKTTFALQLDSGRRVQSFHGRSCAGYRQGRQRLDYNAL